MNKWDLEQQEILSEVGGEVLTQALQLLKIPRESSRYIEKHQYGHSVRVMKMAIRICHEIDRKQTAQIALLHDFHELTGTKATVDDMAVEEALLLLTHSGGNYQQYIEALQVNRIAVLVKLCDIVDNLSDRPTAAQQIKYLMALQILTKAY